MPLGDVRIEPEISDVIFQEYWIEICELKSIHPTAEPWITLRDEVVLTRIHTRHSLMTHSHLLNKFFTTF